MIAILIGWWLMSGSGPDSVGGADRTTTPALHSNGVELSELAAGGEQVALAEPPADWGHARLGTPGVRLAGSGVLVGTVIERESGMLVPGVTVQLLPVPPVLGDFFGRVIGLAAVGSAVEKRLDPIAITTTDALGNFRFEGVRRGTWYVDVVAEYHVPETVLKARVHETTGDGPLDVFVRTGGRVLGHIEGPDGTPQRGARLQLEPGPGSVLTAAGRGEIRVHEVTSDELGRFLFPAVPPGDGWEITAIGSGFAVSHALGIRVHAGKDSEVRVRTRAGGSITGTLYTVAAEEGSGSGALIPLAGASVGVVPRGLRHMRCAREILDATHALTDQDGRYHLQHVPTGTVDVLAMAPGHVPAKGPEVHVVDDVEARAEDFCLSRGPSVQGIVTDVAGRPLDGVMVRWKLVDLKELEGGISFAPLLAQAMKEFDFPSSGSQGRFEAGPFPGGAPYRIEFHRSGYQEVIKRWDPAQEQGELAIVMHLGGSIEGIAMDVKAAKPMAHFSVSTRQRIEVEAQAPGRQNPFSGGQVFEDGSGRFRLTSMRSGEVTLTFSADGYLDQVVQGVQVSEGEISKGVIVKMTPGGVIRGVVQDTDGRPLAGVQIIARDQLVDLGDQLASGAAGKRRRRGRIPLTGVARFALALGLGGESVVLSDGAGRFELKGLAEGQQELLAVHRDYRTGRLGDVQVELGAETLDVVIELFRGGAVEGRVTDRFDRPVEEGIVIALSPGAFKGDGGGALYQGCTDEQGNYLIEHMDPGGYFLVLTRGDEALEPVSFLGTLNFGMVSVGAEETVRYDIVDTSIGACRVHGIVRSQGEPLVRGTVVAMNFEAEGLLGVDIKVAPIRDGGAYEFEGLAAGEYSFRIEGRGPRTSLSVEVPDASDLQLDLNLPEGSIAGSILDAATGEVVAGAQLVLRPAEVVEPSSILGRLMSRGGGTQRARADEKGRFEFVRLSAGDWVLEASGPPSGAASKRYSPAPNQEITLFEGEHESHVEVRLEAALGVDGIVLGADGDPLEGATIVARAIQAGFRRTEIGRSAADGSFDVRPLAPGTYTLEVSAKGHAPLSVETFELRRGQPGDPLQLRMAKGVLVTVEIYDAAGRPAKGATARLIRAGETASETGVDLGKSIQGFFTGAGGAGEDGVLKLGRFAPGDYEIEVRQGLVSKSRQPVQIAGEREEILLRVTID